MIHTDIKFEKLLRWLLPSFLRRDTRLKWLGALASPLEDLFKEFKKYRHDKEYEARMTGQTLLLEDYLNRGLDPKQKRILIKHQNDLARYIPMLKDTVLTVYYFVSFKEKDQASSGDGDDLDPHFHLTIEKGLVLTEDFTVYLPAKADAQAAKIIINRYKIAGKSFTIKQKK